VEVREGDADKQNIQSLGRIEVQCHRLRGSCQSHQDTRNSTQRIEVCLGLDRAKKNSGKTLLDGQEVAALVEKFKLSKQVERHSHEDFLKE
jgi:hypothetical protein